VRTVNNRFLILLGTASSIGLVGCASTWDRVSSQTFRNSPYRAMTNNDEPMQVLRTKTDGTSRAEAMRKLKEPLASGQPEQVQAEALQLLAEAATNNPSPVVRTAAIDALGRFRDPRAVNILIAAYHRADGTATDPKAAGDIQQAGAVESYSNPSNLMGPVGFEPAFITTLRLRVAKALANTSQPEAVQFLAKVAQTRPSGKTEDPSERDVRAAAVRSLGSIRTKESVAVLAEVLKAENGRDVVIAGHAVDGLKKLTGKNIAEPEKWSEVVQAGVELAPEPNMIQRAMGWSSGQ
jgi:HEAT repeats/PBS lyase HEAT-like repeat